MTQTEQSPGDTPPHLCDRALAACARHGFFGRGGGLSGGLYDGLNCGFGSGDNPERVAANRARAASVLGVAPARLLTLYQIHSSEAVTVERPWARADAPRADAMVTREPGLALGILTADCAPVLLADRQSRVIGAAHAGWKGALGGVAEAALDAMERLGAARRSIRAVIGPCISQANYEVGPEFHERFIGADTDNRRYFAAAARAGHWLFDLPAYVAGRLMRAGVEVGVVGDCTYADETAYFSFRRATHRGEPDYGRNLSAIALTDGEARHE